MPQTGLSEQVPLRLETVGEENNAEWRVVLEKLDALRQRPANWNGYDTAAPNPQAVARAERWIETFHRDAAAVSRSWLTPHVTADEEGNVVFEWSRGGKELTVYVLADGEEYLRVPSANPDEEIEQGELPDAFGRRQLWVWLTE